MNSTWKLAPPKGTHYSIRNSESAAKRAVSMETTAERSRDCDHPGALASPGAVAKTRNQRDAARAAANLVDITLHDIRAVSLTAAQRQGQDPTALAGSRGLAAASQTHEQGIIRAAVIRTETAIKELARTRIDIRPCSRMARPSRPPQMRVKAPPAPARLADILVIDDDQGMREVLAIHLSQAGYGVRVAGDAIEGGRMLLEHRPDLLLLDVRMPHMGGDELLALVRTEDSLKDLKVVVLTVLLDSATIERIEGLGVSAYLTKPVNKERLLSAVAKSLEG